MLQVAVMLAREADKDIGRDFKSQRLAVEIGVITLDEAAFFQRAHAAQAGRSRDFRAPRQFHIGDAAVRLQFREDTQIDGIELVMLHGRTLGRDKTECF